MGNADEPRILGCRSDYELFSPVEHDIIFVGGPGGGGELKAGRAVDGEKRRELIKSVRGGEHVELQLTAITFRQRDGSPNKNFLRLNPAKLGDIATSFAKKPFLDDHRSWLRTARQGTILSSEAVELAHNWIGFRQGLQVVKPDAVVSVLDGTLDRFSIGWSRIGAVTCSAHGTDVTQRGSCGCWPGGKVEIDGKQHTVEFEFANAEGTETSGVNAPAVTGTRIEDVRAALAVELGISTPRGAISMNLVTTLAAILGCAATEAEVTRATEKLKSEGADAKRGQLAAEQERDTLRTKLATAEEATRKALETQLASQVDALIEGAYRDGKLLYARDAEGKAIASPQEAVLRRVAKLGIDDLKAWLSGMPQLAPIGKRAALDADPAREYGDDAFDAELQNVADRLGLDVKDVRAEYARMTGEG